MITGAHAIIFSQQADDVRAFFRDTLGFNAVDAGDGWLIFGLPPAEVAVHPAEAPGQDELYLLCDDINATVEELKAKGVEFSKPISDEGWGLLTAIRLPGDAELGIYEPRHPVAARGYRAASRPRTPRA
jgi:catechol 2,3-dioxygenase-like lactoylglutathione lyase family enzyme